MHYFVTGATGFIGRHLVDKLVDEGEEVTALLRTPSKRRLLPSSVNIVEGDLSAFADKDFEIPSVDVVIHLAGTIAADDQDEYRRVNYRYLVDFVRYLEAQPHHPSRFLFASSLAAAGPTKKGRAHTEDDPLNPIDQYGTAKADAETFLQQTTIPVTAFRPPIVLGPEDGASFTLYRLAKRGIGFQVGSEPQEISFVDVRDLVDAIHLMSKEEDGDFKSYFAGFPRSIDVRELWLTLGRVFGKNIRILHVPEGGLKLMASVSSIASKVLPFQNQLDEKQVRQLTAEAFTCSSDRLISELDWTPNYDLEACLRNAVGGYRKAGWL
jgi:nucleoside-diphosphate-sugar epimerase